jgi:hypothetical protein
MAVNINIVNIDSLRELISNNSRIAEIDRQANLQMHHIIEEEQELIHYKVNVKFEGL